MDAAAYRAVVRGIVQGVFFRAFVRRHARKLGLTGYVRNLPSGYEVEVVAEGDRKALEELLEYLKQGPPEARVDHVNVEWREYSGKFRSFDIRY